MNKEQKRRDEIMELEASNYVGGLQKFEALTLEQLETLVKEDFVALTDTKKHKPTVNSFLELMKKYPDVEAHGYVIGADREDYRLIIEGLVFLGKVEENLAIDFKKLCKKADDLRVEKNELYSWWG